MVDTAANTIDKRHLLAKSAASAPPGWLAGSERSICMANAGATQGGEQQERKLAQTTDTGQRSNIQERPSHLQAL